MSQKNVLYLSYDGLTDPVGQSQVLPYLGELAGPDYRFTVISCEKASKKHLQPGVREFLSSRDIDWIQLAYHKQPAVFSTLFDAWRLYRHAVREHREKNFCFSHCRSYIAALVGERLRRTRGLPYIFDMRGFWPDERVDGQLWPQNQPGYRTIYSYFKKRELDFLKNSAATILVTEAARSELARWPVYRDGLGSPAEVIPCCVDADRFPLATPGLRSEARQRLNLARDSLVVCYLGSTGTWYLMDDMLRFYKQLNMLQPESVFLVITNDAPGDVARAAANFEIKKHNLRVVNAQPLEVPLYLAAADWTVFFIKPCYSKKSSSPIKLGESLAMGIPVLCNSGIGDVDSLLKKVGGGIAVTDFADASLRNAARRLVEWPRHDPADLRNRSLDLLSLQRGVDAYRQVYSRVTA